jgi:hypothetical protein
MRLGAIRVHPGFFRVHLRFFFSVWFPVVPSCRRAVLRRSVVRHPQQFMGLTFSRQSFARSSSHPAHSA